MRIFKEKSLKYRVFGDSHGKYLVQSKILATGKPVLVHCRLVIRQCED